ncbi:5308_t:CDS:2 [Cetraspora pellucida]|uniref:5308_t:CDS:1 n=1 Tax=Cetraspora pellucida TaxID=1433469 RepID=A0A9N9I5V8_9GLOM|nr:5308_t:CDS:2 [Cetraspora pellucida]
MTSFRRTADVESGDTFDEFTYEEEELNEVKGYYIVESSDDKVEIYKNPWKEEAGRVHNNADALFRRQEPIKERQGSERFKKRNDKYEEHWKENIDDKDVEKEWNWWDINKDNKYSGSMDEELDYEKL